MDGKGIEMKLPEDFPIDELDFSPADQDQFDIKCRQDRLVYGNPDDFFLELILEQNEQG